MIADLITALTVLASVGSLAASYRYITHNLTEK